MEQVETALHALNAVRATVLGTLLNFADDRVQSPGYDYSFIPQMAAPEVHGPIADRPVGDQAAHQTVPVLGKP